MGACDTADEDWMGLDWTGLARQTRRTRRGAAWRGWVGPGEAHEDRRGEDWRGLDGSGKAEKAMANAQP